MRRPRWCSGHSPPAVWPSASRSRWGRTASATGPSVTVIASHLNNPRALSADGGKLYLAEAGRGGTTCEAATARADRVDRPGWHERRNPAGDRPDLALQPGWRRGARHGLGVRVRRRGVRAVRREHLRAPAGSVPRVPAPGGAEGPGQVRAGVERIVVDQAGVGDHDFIWAERAHKPEPAVPRLQPQRRAGHRWPDVRRRRGANTLDQVMPNGKVKVLTYFNVPSGTPLTGSPPASPRGPTVRCTSVSCSAGTSPPATPACGGSWSRTARRPSLSGPVA